MLFVVATYRVCRDHLISVSSRALNAPVTSVPGGDAIYQVALGRVNYHYPT
jgi:hypothetical protein